MFDWSQISAILISVLVAAAIVLAVLGWRWGNAWLASNKQSKLAALVAVFVAAAEQTMGNATGAQKLDWVTQQIKVYLPGVDAALVRAFVEAAVLQMSGALPGPKPAMPVSAKAVTTTHLQSSVSPVTGKK